VINKVSGSALIQPLDAAGSYVTPGVVFCFRTCALLSVCLRLSQTFSVCLSSSPSVSISLSTSVSPCVSPSLSVSFFFSHFLSLCVSIAGFYVYVSIHKTTVCAAIFNARTWNCKNFNTNTVMRKYLILGCDSCKAHIDRDIISVDLGLRNPERVILNMYACVLSSNTWCKNRPIHACSISFIVVLLASHILNIGLLMPIQPHEPATAASTSSVVYHRMAKCRKS